jgi:hypothetical protein
VPHEPIFDEHARGLARLKLWYVRWVMNHEGMSFDEAARTRVGLRRLTVFAGSPAQGVAEDPDGWDAMLARLADLYDAHADDPDTDALEAEGLALLWPHMEPVIDWDLAAAAVFLAEAFGCFKYEFAKYYVDPEAGDHLTLHIRNAYQPDSPFHHLPEMAADLREIADRSAQERPDVEWVQCGSWLNSVPAFVSLFPPSWRETAVLRFPANHMGWWGQFTDRRGGFNERAAAILRETGQFPNPQFNCHCPLGEWREHLQGI